MILVYGVGRTGSLIAYELVKQGYTVFVYDIDKDKARRLSNDLKTIERGRVMWIDKLEDIIRVEPEVTVIATNTFDVNDWLVRNYDKIKGVFYVFSNVDDITFEELKKLNRFYFCKDSVNRARERVILNGEAKLRGYHWREEPVQRLAELRVKYNEDIKPWHYGAVYWAVKEITQIYLAKYVAKRLTTDGSDGSIDVAFPR